jgi:catechol 2,3-dioxygenase-like lactoylglutathione lyase family enzyme
VTTYPRWYRRLRAAALLLLPVVVGPAVLRGGDAGVADPRSAASDSVVVSLVGLTVSNLDRSIEFYTGVLDFRLIGIQEVAGDSYERLSGIFGVRERVARLQLGGEQLELTEFLAPKGRPAPVEARSNDRWFQHVAIIVSDMDSAYRVLRRHRVQHLSTGPQRLPDSNPSAGGIKAFYFADPDGHPLEILQFPAGKGDPRWHRPAPPLFMGIDHTAIVVRDTEKSLRFYRDLLGLRVAGESWNSGIEQEHLNNVRGARLRITGLRGAAGPGIEFLEYLAPSDGRPYPADERPNDLVHWQTRISGNLSGTAGIVQRNRVPTLSDGIVILPDTVLGFTRGMLVRDPDGHVVQLVDR